MSDEGLRIYRLLHGEGITFIKVFTRLLVFSEILKLLYGGKKGGIGDNPQLKFVTG